LYFVNPPPPANINSREVKILGFLSLSLGIFGYPYKCEMETRKRDEMRWNVSTSD